MNIYKAYQESINDKTNGRIEFLEVYYFIVFVSFILMISYIII